MYQSRTPKAFGAVVTLSDDRLNPEGVQYSVTTGAAGGLYMGNAISTPKGLNVHDVPLSSLPLCVKFQSSKNANFSFYSHHIVIFNRTADLYFSKN
jgi:hypothetical protein